MGQGGQAALDKQSHWKGGIVKKAGAGPKPCCAY